MSELDSSVLGWWDQSKQWTLLSRLLHLNFKEYLAHDLLVKMDRSSMAHGLEVRSPFLDTELIEYVCALPDRMKADLCNTKILLKRTFADLLPSAIQHRSKMGFGVPLGAWFRGRWREPLQDRIGTSRALIGRYLKPDAVRQLIQGHLDGREDAGHRLWLLLTLESWLKQLAQLRAAPQASIAVRRLVSRQSALQTRKPKPEAISGEHKPRFTTHESSNK
jgi:asparagine synthase (glutamine-hydrolysing)